MTLEDTLCRLSSKFSSVINSLGYPTKAGTISSLVTTTTGTVTAGAIYVSFENSGSANITVNSTVLKPGGFFTFPTSLGMKLPAIAYVATGGELTISAVYPPATP